MIEINLASSFVMEPVNSIIKYKAKFKSQFKKPRQIKRKEKFPGHSWGTVISIVGHRTEGQTDNSKC